MSYKKTNVSLGLDSHGYKYIVNCGVGSKSALRKKKKNLPVTLFPHISSVGNASAGRKLCCVNLP